MLTDDKSQDSIFGVFFFKFVIVPDTFVRNSPYNNSDCFFAETEI